jgi:hypothetical protein
MAKVLLENGKGKEVEELLAQESDPHTKDEILAATTRDEKTLVPPSLILVQFPIRNQGRSGFLRQPAT